MNSDVIAFRQPSPPEGKQAVAQIGAVAAAEPTLTRWGYWCGQTFDFGQARSEMTSPDGIAEFGHALAFLEECERTRTVTTPRSSYGWKHVAERVAREAGRPVYISNGMFIAAAIALGFIVERESPRSPNAFLNISRRSGT